MSSPVLIRIPGHSDPWPQAILEPQLVPSQPIMDSNHLYSV